MNWLQRGAVKALGVPQYVENFYDQKHFKIDSIYGRTNYEDYLAQERKMWAYGTSETLERFYKKTRPNIRQRSHSFWQVVNTDMVRVHYPFPQTVSNAFGALLFSDVPEIKVDARLVRTERRLQERMDIILDQNDILGILQIAAKQQSYSGEVGLKLNIDQTISDVPLITSYPKEQMRVERRYGQTIYIDFIDDYYVDETEYQLVSRYGRGYITYQLFKGKDTVPLSTIPQTSQLQDLAFFNSEGDILNVLFAVVVPNKSGSVSDYDGLISLFHALDEVESSLINYIRKTKPNTKMTENLALKDENGKLIPRSDFDNSIILLDTPMNAGTHATQIERDINNPVVKGFIETKESLREQVLTKVSLSPSTIGMPSGGARESSEALEIRERASARTRKEKLSIWEEKLDDFFYATLILDKIMNDEEVGFIEGNVIIENLDEFFVRIIFGDYTVDSLDNRMEQYGEQYKMGLIPIEFALTRIYGPELTRDGLANLIVRTKIEKGIELSDEDEAYIKRQEAIKTSRNRDSILDL